LPHPIAGQMRENNQKWNIDLIFKILKLLFILTDREITGLLRWLMPPRNDVKYWFYASL
jgi:hypothetical protein